MAAVFEISGNKVPSAPGGLAVFANPSPVVPVAFKFYPGDYIESINVNDRYENNGSNDAAILNFIKTGASTAPGTLGLNYIYTWGVFERGANGLGNVQGDYSAGRADMLADYNAQQAVAPGTYYCPTMQCDYNVPTGTNYATKNYNNTICPNWVLNCSGTLVVNNDYTGTTGTTTYHPPAQYGSPVQYGYAYSAWNGSDYTIAACAKHDPGVNQAWINANAAMANTMLPHTVGGVTTWYTADTHPLVAFVRYGDEVSYNFNSGGAGGFDYKGGTGIYALTLTNCWTQYFKWANAMATCWAHTPSFHNVTYGITDVSGTGDSLSAFNTANGYLAATVTSLGGIPGLSQIPGAVLCCSDTYGAHWTYHYNQNLGAQAQNSLQALIGVQTPTGEVGSAPIPAPTNPSMIGVMGVCAQVQTPDYNGSTEAGAHRFYYTATTTNAQVANSAAGVAQIVQAANGSPPPGSGLGSNYSMKAQYRLWCPSSQFRYATPPATPTYGFNINDFPNYIYPTFSTGLPVNTSKPSNMPA